MDELALLRIVVVIVWSLMLVFCDGEEVFSLDDCVVDFCKKRFMK